jgi:CHAD domain-containing protein
VPEPDRPDGGAVETELKLGARPGFELPDLTGVAPGVTVVDLPTLDLDATYVDTADLRLVRRGASLRRRTGEGEPRWTLKLPDTGDGGAALSRRELDVRTADPEVPAAIADLVTAWVRSAPLAPVTVIRTRRRRRALRGADDAPLAEIDDDEVSVLDDGEVAARFREVEVELAPGASADLLTLVGDALGAAGAGRPDRTSKVARALGPRAMAPSEPEVPALTDASTLAELVVAGIAAPVRSLLDHDPVIRLDDDVEGVHKARVATRRLRSNLHTFASCVDARWAGALRDDLADLAGLLGAVRDSDVLLANLWSDLATLDPVDRPQGALLLSRLSEERAGHLATLLAELRSPEYIALLDRLVEAAAAPPLDGRDGRVDRRAVDVVPELVAPRWKRLRRAVSDLGDDPTDADLHRVRILAKRTRYAADVAVPVVGEPAARLTASLARLQDVLGEVNDAAVAGEWLRRVAPTVTHAEAFAAGQLLTVRRQRAARLRGGWRSVWEDCARKGNVRWLS